MEKRWGFVFDLLIGVLVIFIGGWILGSVLNFVALASPHMVSLMFCPEGSTAIHGSPISCRDQNGKSVPALSDADSIVKQRKYIFRPSTIILSILVVGWFIFRRIRKKED